MAHGGGATVTTSIPHCTHFSIATIASTPHVCTATTQSARWGISAFIVQTSYSTEHLELWHLEKPLRYKLKQGHTGAFPLPCKSNRCMEKWTAHRTWGVTASRSMPYLGSLLGKYLHPHLVCPPFLLPGTAHKAQGRSTKQRLVCAACPLRHSCPATRGCPLRYTEVCLLFPFCRVL